MKKPFATLESPSKKAKKARVSRDGQDVANALITAAGGWQKGVLGDLFECFSGGLSVTARLPDDETFEDNVEYIKDVLGAKNVRITNDLPVFHSGCAFVLNPGCLRHEIDTGMQAGMMATMMSVKKIQKENGGFISWSKLQSIFDSAQKWTARTGLGDSTNPTDYIADSSWGWLGRRKGNASDMMKVEKAMMNFVNDPHIWNSLKIDQSVIGKIYGEQGAGWGNLLTAKEARAHIAIDCGACRFPDEKNPHFKIFRFRVLVMNKSMRVLLAQREETALKMQINTRTYDMNPDFVALFTEKQKQKLAEEFDEFMAELEGRR